VSWDDQWRPHVRDLTWPPGLGQYDGFSYYREELMLDPRELSNAEINTVCGGQANSIAINESTTATPTTGSARLSVVGSGTVNFTLIAVRGLATTSVSASQAGS
jgi:hypothetical protein